MANKTVVFTNYFLNGTSGLTLLLLDPETAAIGNGAGDTLTAGSNGLFSAVVTEAITGWWNAVVLQGAVVVLEGGKVYFPSDTLGTYQVDDANSPTTVGTINPNTITSSALASSAVDEIVDAVYDEPMSGHTVNGSYGSHLVRSANQNQNTVQITGSQHIAADMHESQAGSIHATTFDAGAITSTVLATDSITSSQIAASAVTEIQSGLATSSQAVAIKAVTDKLDTAVVLDGAVYQFTANALELGPSGNATVIVQPLSATQPEAVIGTRIPRAVGDVSPIPVDIYDSSGAPVNLTTLGNLEVCVETEANVDLQVVAHANLTISGPSNNKVTWTPNSASVATVAKHRWSLRVASNKKDIAHGVFEVLRVALSDV